MMTGFVQQGPSAIYTFLCHAKEEILGVHVLVNQVHPPFLIC